MKCYELRRCAPADRASCFVWKSFGENPQDLESIKCWILKRGNREDSETPDERCLQCPYYHSLNQEPGIVSETEPDSNLAVISCEGTINSNRNKLLGKTWQALKAERKSHIILDLSKVTNIYSFGLGTIITIYKDTQLVKGLLVVLCPEGYIRNMFHVTKLSRIVKIAGNRREAVEAIQAHRQIQAKKAAQTAVGKETIRQRKAPKERVACYVYWKNKNPRNATSCDQCFKRVNPSNQQCWIVDGMIEGISFQYINEDCERCAYFEEFGSSGD